MSTPSLSSSTSRSSLDDSADGDYKERARPEQKKADAGSAPMSSSDVPSTSNRNPVKRMETWSKGYMPTAKAPVNSSDPQVSPRRLGGASSDSAARGPVSTAPTASIQTPGSSQTPASLSVSGTQPDPVSNPVKPGKATSASSGYDKSRVDGSQIPDSIANALRAGFKGYATVPDPGNPLRTISVPVFNLPPKQIATLFVGLESNFGREKLAGEKMDKPLRDKFGIRNFRLNDVTVLKEINFIEHILKPFIEKEFNNDVYEKVRREVRDGFNRFASKGNEIMLETEAKKNAKDRTIHSLAFMEKFEPVIMPLVDLVCGLDRQFESSSLSRPFKAFLLEIDRSYSEWALKQGQAIAGTALAAAMKGEDWEKAYALANADKHDAETSSDDEGKHYQIVLAEKCEAAPRALFTLKKSALVGAMFNRALIENWVNKFHVESLDPQQAGQPWVKHKKILNGVLGHYTSFKFDDLLIRMMASQPEQPKGFNDYLVPLKKGADMRRTEEIAKAATQSNKRKALERSSTVSATDKGGNEKKGGIAGMIRGLISPRKMTEEKEAQAATTAAKDTVGLLSPRETKKPVRALKSSEGELLKKAETRRIQMERGARKEMKDYLKTLPAFDLSYTAHMNSVITKRANHEEFQLAPAAFCLLKLAEYRRSLETNGNMVPATLDKIELALAKLAIDEKQAAQQALRSQSAKAAPRLPSLDLSALKRSPFEQDDEKPAKAHSSSETERSDSTEVATESGSESGPEREKS
ncbi:MAG: hypothetical protein NBV65_09905 [Burkholderiaceae bacterium]|nr:hypothetical protein [Burkholderiaceae bacterium]